MSKTFKSTTTSRLLTAYSSGNDLSVAVGGELITVSSADAPAFALEVLKAAGVKPADHSSLGCVEGRVEALEEISFWLTKYLMDIEKHAKEAADRESLESEALRLFATTLPFQNPSWSDLSDRQKQLWTAVAETARELHKASSNDG